MFWRKESREGRAGFDEYVICTPARSFAGSWMRWVLWIGPVGLLAVGCFVAWPIVWSLYLHWAGYSGALLPEEFLPAHEPPGLGHWAMVYHAWAVPIGLLTLAVLLGSAILIARQIEQEYFHTRLSQLPAVYVRPRLSWELRGIHENSLHAVPQRLFIDLFNVGDSLAIRVQSKVVSLVVQEKIAGAVSDREIKFDDPYDKTMYYDKLVPADRESFYGPGSVTENLVECHSFKIPASAGTVSDGDFLHKIIVGKDDDDYPAMVLVLEVAFETIRNVNFNETIAVRWSAQRCRAVASSGQLDNIKELKAIVEHACGTGWAAGQAPPKRRDGQPVHDDLSRWTRLSLSPEVANRNSAVGKKLVKGETKSQPKNPENKGEPLRSGRSGGRPIGSPDATPAT